MVETYTWNIRIICRQKSIFKEVDSRGGPARDDQDFGEESSPIMCGNGQSKHDAKQQNFAT